MKSFPLNNFNENIFAKLFRMFERCQTRKPKNARKKRAFAIEKYSFASE